MILYLVLSVVDDLFTARAKLSLIMCAQLLTVAHSLLFLALNMDGPHQMTKELQFFYFLLIAFSVATELCAALSVAVFGRRSSWRCSAFSAQFVVLGSAALSAFLVFYGAFYYNATQRINWGDGVAFIGYALCFASANVFIFVELFAFNAHRAELIKRRRAQTHSQYGANDANSLTVDMNSERVALV